LQKSDTRQFSTLHRVAVPTKQIPSRTKRLSGSHESSLKPGWASLSWAFKTETSMQPRYQTTTDRLDIALVAVVGVSFVVLIGSTLSLLLM
jgi:hypothetical protein